ncbi:MAG: MetQ/NlpA family ABC transporter substrate-binding protein [Fretibacterium sp.]|nr:MetQ/NlpA family ABC transporter substrate-binding protein [Fretibacterium sp.]
MLKKLMSGVVLSFLVFSGAEALEKIKLGVDGGPHEEIAEVVQKIAAEKGLEIELVLFADFILPNAALADGDIDVNSFQHLPYMENMMKDRGYKLKSIGNTVLMPMGAYSKKVRSPEEIQEGMVVAIPNDPSNGGRALLLLQDNGLISLDPAQGLLPTVLDITENRLSLKFVELDAAQMVRAIEDTDLSIITTNYAVESGLVPARDAFLIESNKSPYVNIIAVREGEEDRPEFKILVESYQNDTIKKFVDEKYKGAIVSAW